MRAVPCFRTAVLAKGGSFMTERQRKFLTAAGFVVFILFLFAVFYWVGQPMIRFVSEPEKFREWVDERGLVGELAFIGMAALQVFVAFIPGEPLEIGAGYAFGTWKGLLLCEIGIAVGSAIVFLFVKKFGQKAAEVFFPREKINSFGWFHNAQRLKPLIFLVFFIPGTPKDILTYIAGLTDVSLGQFLLISLTARIPSIVTSTFGGNALGIGNYLFAVAVFAATLLVSAAGVAVYGKIQKIQKN